MDSYNDSLKYQLFINYTMNIIFCQPLFVLFVALTKYIIAFLTI